MQPTCCNAHETADGGPHLRPRGTAGGSTGRSAIWQIDMGRSGKSSWTNKAASRGWGVLGGGREMHALVESALNT